MPRSQILSLGDLLLNHEFYEKPQGENMQQKINRRKTASRIRRSREAGYTLLEYCAGAAIITGILWGALGYLGNSLDGLLRGVGSWAQARTQEISINPR